MIPRTPDVRERSISLCSCGASHIRGPRYCNDDLFGLPDIDLVAAAQSGLLDGLAGNFVATVSA